MIYIVYGVSGCGKSTLGSALADQLDIPFLDADDFHPQSNIDKMKSGQPLNDDDRQPWLERLNAELKKNSKGAVLACSALKESYRQILSREVDHIEWILLDGSKELIRERLLSRTNHFLDDSLLDSQFSTLEKPSYGLVLNPEKSIDSLVKEITNSREEHSQLGLIGLGVMGSSLSRNILENNWRLSVFNRASEGEEHVTADFVKSCADQAVLGFTDLTEFVASIEQPRRIIVMVPAGKAIDSVTEQLSELLDKNDIIVDAGNSHYLDTQRRAEALADNGIRLIGTGVSGGEKGARFGPAIMPGGDREVYELMAPVLKSIAAKNEDGIQCCQYVGLGGSGHFVKMIHNGIEYAEMALIAELYGLLRHQLSNEEIASFFSEINAGWDASYLLEISIAILRKRDGEDYLLDNILDKAGNKGTGSWSVTSALQLGQVASMMSAAVEARYTSSYKGLRKTLSSIKASSETATIEPAVLKDAYHAARLINHHQGFEVISAASQFYNWNVNLSNVSQIWTAGCIIRSKLMSRCVSLLENNKSLIETDEIFQEIDSGVQSLKTAVKSAIDMEEYVPVLSAALQYYYAMTSEQSNANMIQAQRDFFGAHTYELKGNPGNSVHTNWEDYG